VTFLTAGDVIIMNRWGWILLLSAMLVGISAANVITENRHEHLNSKNKQYVTLGYAERYDALPTLTLTDTTEAEYLRHLRGGFFKKNTRQAAGQFAEIKTDRTKHQFRKWHDGGPKHGHYGVEVLGYYPLLKLHALIETTTSVEEGLSFGQLVLLDQKTDYFYGIASVGDGAVELPIPSKNNQYLVYFYNAAYQHKQSDIAVLKLGSKSSPEKYLTEYASYRADNFRVENIVWVDDQYFIIKAYEEELVDNAWQKNRIRYYKVNIQ
jgi:hypothetical protein